MHSCSKSESFSNTIILGLTDLIRYYSFFDTDVTTYTGFVFPKLDTNKCVVEVTVEFKDFRFYYTLSQVAKEDVSDRLKNVCYTKLDTYSPTSV